MPYIRRDPAGQIESLHRDPSAAATEFLADGDAEVAQFLGHDVDSQQDFSRLDADFVRVLEDLIDTLIARHVMNLTDLPAEAQSKLLARKSFRERTTRNALRLFEATGFHDLV